MSLRFGAFLRGFFLFCSGRSSRRLPPPGDQTRKAWTDRAHSAGLLRATLAPLLDRAHREPSYEAVEEQIVQQRDWETSDQTGGHKLTPEIDVAANQECRHAYPYHLVPRRRDESQSVDELLRYECERKYYNRQDARNRNRHDEPHECAKARKTIDHRGVFQFARDRFEKSHQQPGGEWDREARIHKHQRPNGVLQAKQRHDAG